MGKMVFQCIMRRAKAVRMGTKKKPKGAAIECIERTFPQFSRRNVDVIRGITLGIYIPAPIPRNKTEMVIDK